MTVWKKPKYIPINVSFSCKKSMHLKLIRKTIDVTVHLEIRLKENCLHLILISESSVSQLQSYVTHLYNILHDHFWFF